MPVTDSRGDAASIWPLRSVPRSARSPVTCPTASSSTARSLMRNLKSFRGTSNVPLPLADSSTVPDSGTAWIGQERDCAGRNPPAVGVERVGRIPADERGAGDRAGALRDLGCRRAARPCHRSAATRSRSGSARRRPRRRRSAWARRRSAVPARPSGGTRRTSGPTAGTRRFETRGAGCRDRAA